MKRQVIGMKERINRLAKGIIDSEQPKMTWSPEKIDETLRMNTLMQRNLWIGSENGLSVKGFVYSSNLRVRIPGDNNSFGGLRCRIVYEVDTSFLTAGDTITGSFYLVTNCGEEEIPYEFHVEVADAGKTLGDLKTAEDFLHIAENDMETALRLLEYPDFVEVPFMQDMHVRALYDGLKGHGSRANFMEEFLVGLGVKKPVGLTIPGRARVYAELAENAEDTIEIRMDNWGSVYLEVTADGEFLHLPKKSATQADFEDGLLRLPVRILAERLHAGKNFGAVLIHTARETVRIPIEASAADAGGCDRAHMSFQKELGNYLTARLAYENGIGGPEAVHQMQRELDLMKMTHYDAGLRLLQAELYLLTDRREKAQTILKELQDSAALKISGDRKLNCLYRYLYVTLTGNAEQKDTLIRLLQQYASEETGSSLFYYLMLLRLDEELQKNPVTVLISMEQEFKDGCHSPFLYAAGLKLLESDPILLDNAGNFELHALYYGARRKIISRELALAAVRVMRASRSYREFYRRLLTELYGLYPETEILEALCAMLIRGDCRETACFEWYSRALEADLSLTRLYEYYLYAMPENYDRLMSREVFLYFSYSANLDAGSLAKLYANLLTYGTPDSDIYRMYERAMEEFAVDQLFKERIDGALAVLYRKLIYPELIDTQMARVLPGILKSCRVECREPAMKYVVVRHEEQMTEDAYVLNEGTAYVPLFSERDLVLFQDENETRYARVNCAIQPVFTDMEELLQTCFEMNPMHPFLFMNACAKACRKEVLTGDDAILLEHADQKMELHPLFRAKVLSAIVRYYKRMADGIEDAKKDGSVSYLLSLDKDQLTRDERNGVCGTLIRCGHFSEAYEMVCRYGLEGLPVNLLLRLCGRMLLQNLFDRDDHLLYLTWYVFEHEKPDSVILDYLCEHFNGTVDQMYRVLMQGLRLRVETYDLEERLVAQMIFTGNTAKLDQVFEFYASRKKTGENIVRAYFTVKSVEYFLENRPTDDKVFAFLEGAVQGSSDRERIPDIYLLALTKYYATLPELSEEQRRLCQSVVDVLLDAGMIFAYFKDLARFIHIPGNILDKEIIEYRGNRAVRPYLRLRILPQEEEFHYEEMRLVYRDIYIREKVIFEGETLEYQIEEEEDGVRKTKEKGEISCREIPGRSRESRFAALNEMSLSLKVNNETALREKMREYQKRDAAVSALFPIA